MVITQVHCLCELNKFRLKFKIIERPRARTSPRFFGHFLKCLKLAEFWHVGFVSPEKHCSEVFLLGCFSFSRNNVCKKGPQVGKSKWFIAYAISRERSKLQRENYGTLLNIPERNCMRNLERFRQSSPLIKILDALFPPSPSSK